MRSAPYFGLVLLLALSAPAARAVDRVKSYQGAQLSGKVVATSPTQVTVEIGATRRDMAVNEIESVQFDQEPNELTQARFAVKGGRNREALAMLAKIAPASLTRPLVAKDVEFYTALAAAQQALAGEGSIAEAGKRMFTFEKANHDSFHYFQACETLGDLLAGLGNWTVAESYYAKLADAPWTDYKMRAGVHLGRSLVGQKKYAEALARFDDVLKTESTGKETHDQIIAAKLGKASALSGEGKIDEAATLVEEVIATADPADDDLHARAYNILGNCYQTAGKPKQAILAFLHVDLLYPVNPAVHAEALANLAKLFAAEKKPDRAAQARATLAKKYPNSEWAKN